jgi:chromosome partitioning protein
MARIVAVANQKGGVGKTTTAVNLSAAIARLGRSVLLVDLDPQANASSGVGMPPGTVEYTAYDLLLGRKSLVEVIRPTEFEGLFLVPATPGLAGAEIELIDEQCREARLQEVLAGVTPYDFVFIDCPPSLGLLTLNALVASDSLLIPLQCEYFALEGVSHLLETFGLVKERMNPKLEIEGVVLTMFDGRLNLSVQVADEARRHFGERVYATMIPRNVRLGEAPSFGRPISEYDPACIGAASYNRLAQEILAK